jgi:hypothetical protein
MMGDDAAPPMTGRVGASVIGPLLLAGITRIRRAHVCRDDLGKIHHLDDVGARDRREDKEKSERA